MGGRTMKPELQRIRIAEACGFDKSHWLELGGGIVLGTSACLPDYPNDLNAMHEAEVVIIKLGYTAIRTYEDLLQKQIANIIFATAAQRAEAFLKALNLWKI
jgi:hypothetical protein